MQFNKLYNLILQSILNQNRQSRAKMLQATFADQVDRVYIEDFLNNLNNNKAADFLCKFFCSGQLTDPEDQRIEQVINILKRNTNFDIQQNISLNQFLNKNKVYIEREKGKNLNLDKIKYFSDKQQYPNGVVIYRVEQSKGAQRAVRKIMDAQWGYDANPWCLLADHGQALDDHYRQHWMYYTSYPKHIAFQNGKLLAFCASGNGDILWWDRNDHSTPWLILQDGSQIEPEIPEWTPREKLLIWIEQKHLIYNKETKRYDCSRDLKIENDDLRDGHFPIPLGVINGDFEALRCTSLIDLTNGPIEVFGGYNIMYCSRLKTLNGLAEWIGNYLAYDYCTNLEDDSAVKNCEFRRINPITKKGCKKLMTKEQIIQQFIDNHNLRLNKETGLYDAHYPIDISDEDLIDGHLPVKFGYVHGHFSVSECKKLKTLQGSPKTVGGSFYCRECMGLSSFEGCPEVVQDHFYAEGCMNVTTLKGTQHINKRDITFINCPLIPDEERIDAFLERNQTKLTLNSQTNRYDSNSFLHIEADEICNGHFPVPLGKIEGGFKCTGCYELTSLVNGPIEVSQKVDLTADKNLKSLAGLPKTIGTNLDLTWTGIRNLKGIPQNFSGSLYIDECNSLTGLEGCSRKVRQLRARNCKNLESLIGGPEETNWDFNINMCEKVKSLEGCPKKVGGDFSLGNCTSLTSFEHGPQYVGGRIIADGCKNITSEAGLEKIQTKEKPILPNQLKWSIFKNS